MRAKILMVLGAALMGSALIMFVVGESLRGEGQELVVMTLRICALADVLIGGVFLFVGLRRLGESGK
jgi:hypothetical protein